MSAGRIILVGGGARSGKSDFALGLARRLGARRLFLATAQALDDEMRVRIERHRLDRGSDFHTVEEPLDVARVFATGEADVILLDCLTLWLSNLLLASHAPEAINERVRELAAVLAGRRCHAVIVTNEVGLGIVPENALARVFRDVAGRAHRLLADAADEVYFAVLGTMQRIKPSDTPADRQRISSGTPWEKAVGYARAVRSGPFVFVSGTTASDEQGRTVAAGNAYEQTRYILSKIARALQEAGADLNAVVRTRMFVTDISLWEEIGRAHGEFFGAIRPAATMVEVRRLVNPDHLVEIEVDAVVDRPRFGEPGV